MTTLDYLFTEFLGMIQPNEAAVDRAVAAHQDLRKDLEQDDTYGPYVERTLLSGSYGRNTAIKGIKDVDIIIQTTYTQGYLDENKRDSETAQEYLLRLTQEALKRTGRVAKTRKRRRSVYVHLPEEINDMEETLPELTLDIVPVLIQSDKDLDPMTIADKDLGQWCETYPVTQLQDSRDRNKSSNRIGDRHMYKPLVKMFKAWKLAHFQSTKTPQGFVLECLTAKYHNPNAEHWVDAVRDLFRAISDEWPIPDDLGEIPNVPDISNASPFQIPIAKKLTGARKVIRRIHDDLELLEQAIEEAESDLEMAADTLQRVFGQDCEIVCFPEPDDNGGSSRDKSLFAQGSKRDIREAPEFG
ncbi:MAG: hypothetical protein GF311_27600 [Candidatus Lokiarchaeota archaeon]|nr:hypothetical protein [Candidatus Lokiarchaeota archaeon]